MKRANGFEEAEIGVTESMVPVIVYDYDRCIKILIDRDEMSHTDAIEYMQHNVVHAWVGDSTPIFMETMTSAEIDDFADSLPDC